jgi:hypothetical protein
MLFLRDVLRRIAASYGLVVSLRRIHVVVIVASICSTEAQA